MGATITELEMKMRRYSSRTLISICRVRSRPTFVGFFVYGIHLLQGNYFVDLDMKRILLFLLLSTFSFSQAEDWIYYYSPYDIGRLRPDGSENELFHSLNVPLMHRITDISLDKSKLLYVHGSDHGEAVSIDIESMDMQMSEMNGEGCPWCDFHYPEKARFTYDDNYIVFEDYQNLYKYSFIDSTVTLLIEGEEEWGEGGLKKISMSPDKQKIAYLGYDSDSTRVIVFDIQSNESTVIGTFPILVDSCTSTGQIFWVSDNNIFFTMCDTITQSQLFKLHISNGDAAQLIENDIHNILETHDSVLEKLVYTKMMADSLEYWMVDLESNELLKLDIMNVEYAGYSIMWHHQVWSPDKSKVILNGMYTTEGLNIYNTFTDSLTTIFVDNQDYQIFNTMFWVGDNIDSNSIEGRWISEIYSNTMYEFDGSVRRTYYCTADVCDSTYWNSLDTSDALPTQNPYTFINDTLTIDLHFGNFSEEVVTFLCDGNVIDFNSQQSNLFRVGTDLDECEDYDGQQLDISDFINVPNEFKLHQNYPNPFNPTTQIKYDLPEDALVAINIYDLMGRSIKSLVNSNQSAGYRSIQWNATNNLGEPVSAGMYIYMIQAGEFRQTKKMVLLK
jgi:hypothetical protein